MKLPQAVKVCLWSYDTNKIDFSIPGHRYITIMNILNRGTMEAVEWMWQNFSEKEIKEIIKKSSESEWSRKSLSFWSQIYDVLPSRKSRFA